MPSTELAWTYCGCCADGESFLIDGLDVWRCEWVRRPGETAVVRDPHYQQRFEFAVYELRHGADRVVVAAGEFSNCIWGFYRPVR
jgi:hypothetical protein